MTVYKTYTYLQICTLYLLLQFLSSTSFFFRSTNYDHFPMLAYHIKNHVTTGSVMLLVFAVKPISLESNYHFLQHLSRIWLFLASSSYGEPILIFFSVRTIFFLQVLIVQFLIILHHNLIFYWYY